MAQNCEGIEYRTSPHAGTWYPGNEGQLREIIDGFLKNARAKVHGEIFGLVAPHAGYVYSGPVAAFAYKTVEGMEFDDVIVIGPSHRHGFYGASVDTLGGRQTPLGKIEYDVELAKKIIAADKNIGYEPAAHAAEHSVEIQMPFIQYTIKSFKAVEIIMGTQDYKTCEILSQAIVNSTKGRSVLIVASSDLSHYHSQKDAENLDNMVVEAMAKFDPELLHNRLKTDSCEACGGGPMITAMLISRQLGADKSKPLYYATSGDITGDRTQVVGYMAAAFYKEQEMKVGVDLGFSKKEKEKLKTIARETIEAAVHGKKLPQPTGITKKLKEPYGIFVTINKQGNLRGCIGRIIGDQPLYLTCQQMARAAALEDPRFPPVAEKELSSLQIEISILTPMKRISNKDEIVVGRDGLYIRKGMYSGLLLPQVAAEYGWTVDEFLTQTCYKAGLSTDVLNSKDTEIYRFSAEVF
ncbi:MAG: AmmeMemoRadiSam system protein B [candidate division WOR-3 bacterium]|nr:MAG: AmmeMemoRadiSam system protein B [candidate division WOR-3 bacterium]